MSYSYSSLISLILDGYRIFLSQFRNQKFSYKVCHPPPRTPSLAYSILISLDLVYKSIYLSLIYLTRIYKSIYLSTNYLSQLGPLSNLVRLSTQEINLLREANFLISEKGNVLLKLCLIQENQNALRPFTTESLDACLRQFIPHFLSLYRPFLHGIFDIEHF